MGQYTQVDPIGLAGGNPTLYGYVFNPLINIDPFGLAQCQLSAEDLKNMGPKPEDMRNAHRHHIVRETPPANWRPENQGLVGDAQDILRNAGIDINTNPLNYVWAPNGQGNHTIRAARETLRRLKDAGGSVDRIKQALIELGEMVARGDFL